MWEGDMRMELIRLEGEFSVCRLADASLVDWARPFLFFAKTDDEISLVCPADAVPANATDVAMGWRAFKIAGVLDFGMLGVIAGISEVLRAAGVGVFVASTYNTDYVFVRTPDFECAGAALSKAGYAVI